MALDHLLDRRRDGGMQRRYRHDLETLIWILPWVCMRYHAGREIQIQGPPLARWKSADRYVCGEAKVELVMFFAESKYFHPTASYRDEWRFACDLMVWVYEGAKARAQVLSDTGPDADSNREKLKARRPSDTYDAFWSAVGGVCERPQFDYLRTLIPADMLTQSSSPSFM
ncbi:hypothetical protein DENSPDRAFT_842353 [Dentipellis sp. KUC8613]|nr:hypothetical protein DENSPDRAFT_842353 [Dentipellis sp. KUC8613]